MNNLDSIVFVVYLVCIAVYLLSVIVTTLFVIPLQVKEAKVHNGLASLRKQMLAKGVLSLLVALVSILILFTRVFITSNGARNIILFLIFINAVGIFFKSLIDSIIYHSQYTTESKELHKKIAILEKKENRAKKL